MPSFLSFLVALVHGVTHTCAPGEFFIDVLEIPFFSVVPVEKRGEKKRRGEAGREEKGRRKEG
jgi:hypothetical protein